MNVVISKTAADELRVITHYYRNIHLSLEERVLLEFERIIDLVGEFPLVYRATALNLRIALFPSFPYEIYYRVKKDLVEIVRILPARIDPANKKEFLRNRE